MPRSPVANAPPTTYRVIGETGDAPLAAEHFHMNLVRCEPGKSAPLHNHLTQEVRAAARAAGVELPGD